MTLQVPIPVLFTKEGKWFVASCPLLDIATQGKTERKVKENLAGLIDQYLRDPDTAKPTLEALLSLSLTTMPVRIPEGLLYRKASTAAKA
ncbi:MAG TPA: hypothetical protein VEG61_03890 [Candidatus Dormibacteraeota bacterium]|nr:hypothetical protein [Candidatus Dormibacteraeota bacterium]